MSVVLQVDDMVYEVCPTHLVHVVFYTLRVVSKTPNQFVCFRKLKMMTMCSNILN